MKTVVFLFGFIICYSTVFAQQFKGKIIDENGKGIHKVNISVSGISKLSSNSFSNSFGKFNLKLSEGKHKISFNHINFKTKTIEVNISEKEIIRKNIVLDRNVHLLDDIEIIEKKTEKTITDVLSVNIIDAKEFQEESNIDLSDIVQRFSGITLTDNQISIRGGSGWNAMAGSRVLVLIDDIPLLSGDMGQIPWDLIPIENIDQIEVTKGASSAIYGSSAMNGVINVKTKTANHKLISQHPFIGHTKISTKCGMYDNPKNINIKWWNGSRKFYSSDILHSNIIGNTSISLGLNHFKDEGYRFLEESNRSQLSLNLLHHSEKVEGLLYGVNGTFMKQNVGHFLLWESYDQAYIPIDSNLYQTNSTLFHIDPFLNFTTQNGKHIVKSRFMRIGLDNSTNEEDTGKDLFSETYYLDYKYKGWSDYLSSDIIIGATINDVFSYSEVFNGENRSNSQSLYAILERQNDNTTISIGSRYEFIKIKSEKEFELENGNLINDFKISYPLFYAGVKHKVNVNSNFRTYFGQGVRFPSIAEMSASTNIHAGTYIYPNLALKPESGWSFESAYHFNKKIKKFLIDFDLAYFLMKYENMMEFSFAQWGTEYDIEHAYGLGFKTVNIGQTQIEGIETEINTSYNMNTHLKSNISIGYTYMNPISLTPDSVYAQTNNLGVLQDITFNNSSSDTSILKYRYQHLFKYTAQLQYKKLSAGIRVMYNDYMRNIDNIFTTELVNDGIYYNDTIQIQPPIIPGINESRENNKNGDLLIDFNFGFQLHKFAKLNFIINNVLNSEILTRPTDLQAPRRFLIKLNLSI